MKKLNNELVEQNFLSIKQFQDFFCIIHNIRNKQNEWKQILNILSQ